MAQTDATGASGSAFDRADAEALRESIAKVLEEECDSRALHEHIDGKVHLGSQLWARAAELGWLAIGLPDRYGGLGAGVEGLHILHTELGQCAAPGSFLSSLSFGQALLACGDADIAMRWLPELLAGGLSAAVPADFGHPVRDGIRTLLGSADAAVALLPRADGEWCLVELESARVSEAQMWDRTRSLIDVEVADQALVSALPNSREVGRRLQQVLALGIAADSLGGARGIATRTLAFVKERHQFGRPIASFQALKHRLADHFTRIAHTEHVVAHGVHAAARGGADANTWAAMAKASASNAYSEIAADCIQLHGGVGFAWEYDPHIFQKRADLNEALLSNNRRLIDEAADDLVAAVRAGEPVLEL